MRSVEVQTRAVERAKLNIPDPEPVKFGTVKWVVVTPENSAQIFEQLNKDGVDAVLFSLTDDSYEQLATDLAELRSWIVRQREIIKKYREYYEPRSPEATKP